MNLLNEDQVRILERLKVHGTLSVDSLTGWIKKPKTAVRRTLLNLEKRGFVVRELEKKPRGRPTLCFKLGVQSKIFFPSKEAELLNELLNYLAKQGQGVLLENFFKEYWERRYNRVMEKIASRKCRDLGARLEALKEVLNEDGFFARSHLSKKNDQVTLRECHCPISAAAKATRIPCHLEAQLISRVLSMNCISSVPMSATQQDCQFKLKSKYIKVE